MDRTSKIRLRAASPIVPIRKKFGAFTLVELIVVITILAILATIGFLALSGYSQDAKDSAVKANLRSVMTAISSESAITGNSPRYYVVHDTGAALSGAVVAIDWAPVSLTWGAWNADGTNYSAGNPDWTKLKMNPEKFKLAMRGIAPISSVSAEWDQSSVSVGAFSSVSSSFSWKKRPISYFQVAGISPATKLASVVGDFPTTLSGSVQGLVKNPSDSSATGALVDGLASATVAGPITSCLAAKNAGNNADGVYSIDPDGTGPNAAFNVYCDMTTDGGGWTRAFLQNGTNTVDTTSINVLASTRSYAFNQGAYEEIPKIGISPNEVMVHIVVWANVTKAKFATVQTIRDFFVTGTTPNNLVSWATSFATSWRNFWTSTDFTGNVNFYGGWAVFGEWSSDGSPYQVNGNVWWSTNDGAAARFCTHAVYPSVASDFSAIYVR